MSWCVLSRAKDLVAFCWTIVDSCVFVHHLCFTTCAFCGQQGPISQQLYIQALQDLKRRWSVSLQTRLSVWDVFLLSLIFLTEVMQRSCASSVPHSLSSSVRCLTISLLSASSKVGTSLVAQSIFRLSHSGYRVWLAVSLSLSHSELQSVLAVSNSELLGCHTVAIGFVTQWQADWPAATAWRMTS